VDIEEKNLKHLYSSNNWSSSIDGQMIKSIL